MDARTLQRAHEMRFYKSVIDRVKVIEQQIALRIMETLETKHTVEVGTEFAIS